jgi:hypothetical protein
LRIAFGVGISSPDFVSDDLFSSPMMSTTWSYKLAEAA